MLSGLSGISGMALFASGVLDPNVGNSRSFIATWKTDNAGVTNSTTIQLPLINGGAYDLVVGWGDNTSSTVTAWNDANATHTYAGGAGTYTVCITPLTGTIKRWAFNNGGDKAKILNVSRWGKLEFTTDEGAFYGCSNLTSNATDSPLLQTNASLVSAFRDCTSLVGGVENWDVSSVINTRLAFASASSFNSNISSWNVGAVANASSMFQSCIAFNRNLNAWNTNALVNAYGVFAGCNTFNQPLAGWNMSKVTSAAYMFDSCSVFNQPLGTWNTVALANTGNMFISAAAFNQNLGGWNVALLTNAAEMFGTTGLSGGYTSLNTTNYDALLNGWANTANAVATFSAGGTKYSAAGADARAVLVGLGWTITDGGAV